VVASSVTAKSFTSTYADVYRGEDRWVRLTAPEGDRFDWKDDSTYVRNPPYFDGMTMEPAPLTEIQGRTCWPCSAIP
jgi:aconitate hydratase